MGASGANTGGTPGIGGTPAAGGGIANPATCQPGTEPHRPPQRVVLVSELEQINSLRDLLGADAVPADPSLPTDRGRTLDLDLVNQVSTKSLDAHDTLITAVAKNVKTRTASVTQCRRGRRQMPVPGNMRPSWRNEPFADPYLRTS